MIRRSRTLLVASLTAIAAVLGGCGIPSVENLPLPGGADVGSHPYQVKAVFRDVLDLVPNSGVEVNNVPVGRVSAINLAGSSWNAEVTMVINGDVRLPANAIAQLQQSSLLGEKYVELADPPPPQRPMGTLTDGAVIPLARTNRSPEVEEVLGALSLLLNGGGIGQLQDITRQLNDALAGRETDVRSLLTNVNTLVGSLNAQRGDITNAIDAVNRLSANLNDERGDLNTALNNLGPGIAVLNQQRTQLVTMLEALNKLSGVATNVVNQTQGDLVRNLNNLAPTLRQLAAAGNNLPNSFETLVTFPFPDNVVNAIGNSDYVNLYATVDLNLSDLLTTVNRSLPVPAVPVPLPSAPPVPPGPAIPPLPKPPVPPTGGLLGGILGGL